MKCDIEKTTNGRSGQIPGFLCGSLIRSMIVATLAERKRRDGAGLIVAKSPLNPTWAEIFSRGDGWTSDDRLALNILSEYTEKLRGSPKWYLRSEKAMMRWGKN
jgi:hypothetical protein